MFKKITNRLANLFSNLRGYGRLTEKNIQESLRQVRVSLLEADLPLPVINSFVEIVKKKSLGQDINNSLNPGQVFIKIMYCELLNIMSYRNNKIFFKKKSLSIFIIIGLNGSGKTITSVKLGNFFRNRNNKKVLITSLDLYRSSSIKQLNDLSHLVKIDFFYPKKIKKIEEIVQESINYANQNLYNLLIIDTPGFIDCRQAEILKKIYFLTKSIKPIEIILVVDSMMGQASGNIAKSINNVLPCSSVILTKIDGNSRVGAAFSIFYYTKIPIKFLGTSEKVNKGLEFFNSKKIVSRIFGTDYSVFPNQETRDIIRLSTKLENYKKITKDYTLDDFLNQLNIFQKMGGIKKLINKYFGILEISNVILNKLNDKKIKDMKAIILSMTIQERKNPKIKNFRKKCIAYGSGTSVADINQLIIFFKSIKKLVKKTSHSSFYNILYSIKNIIKSNNFN
ncbi:MAG: signal recognition particle receptor subunit alpha [Arsenophonus sp.]|nr:MAG: signal recognition particle receptor subunit alpha [Arsenophonus sp.]